MAVSKRLRFEIFRRDNHTCRYCGATAPDVPLRVDHVVPQALGGNDEPSNLVTACQDCNSGKTSTAPDQSLVDDVASDAIRWSKAMAQVADIRERESQEENKLRLWFNGIWCSWKDWRGEPLEVASDYEKTIKTFLNSGLTYTEIEDLIHVSMNAKHVSNKQKWKYFCGCCWRRIRENQEMASQILLEQEDPLPVIDREPTNPMQMNDILAKLFNRSSAQGGND